MTLPVRERIMQELEARFAGLNVDDNNGVEFKFVQREELDHTKKFQGNAVSLLDISQSFIYQTAYLQCTLRVGVEYCHSVKSGETARTELNTIAAEITKTMLADTSLVETDSGLQLTENIQIVDDSTDVQGPFEKVVSGYMQFDIIYRTKKDDPYALM